MTAEKFIEFDSLDNEAQELIRESIEAMKMSYSPYSNFKVGAALKCDDGTITRGCNIENSSFPASICAERTAISKAISDGRLKFKAIAVAAKMINNLITSPCGVCRQTLAEFGDMPVYLTDPTMTKVVETSVKDLLPLAFHLNKAGP
ncbi:cytidine deaminase-like [Microplitis mediator]|uniref:cytidine deaminase-like n=1 Tax=Microplitis mediator TaxID=375433 RepID=UPI002556C743|nr:cytidine deaminase-like [Microplitis mediator]